MHDAYSALAALSNHPSIDSKNVWFVGFSLGGFLAALSLDAKFTERFSPQITISRVILISMEGARRAQTSH